MYSSKLSNDSNFNTADTMKNKPMPMRITIFRIL